mgnify:CR=1 FL=1
MREVEKPSLSLNPNPIKPNQTHQWSPIKVEEKGQIPANPVEPSTHLLDPDEMASDLDEMVAVYSTLMTVENLGGGETCGGGDGVREDEVVEVVARF